MSSEQCRRIIVFQFGRTMLAAIINDWEQYLRASGYFNRIMGRHWILEKITFAPMSLLVGMRPFSYRLQDFTAKFVFIARYICTDHVVKSREIVVNCCMTQEQINCFLKCNVKRSSDYWLPSLWQNFLRSFATRKTWMCTCRKLSCDVIKICGSCGIFTGSYTSNVAIFTQSIKKLFQSKFVWEENNW